MGYKKVDPELSREDFALFKELILNKSGLHFDENKRDSLRISLLARTTALGLGSFREYYEYLLTRDGEFKELLNLITVNETHFFRDKNQFQALQQKILPELLGKKSRVKIWSAGCSTGEEPYSIAMVLREFKKGDAYILATDVSQQALDKARDAIYGERSLREVGDYYKNKYFQRVGRKYKLSEEIRKMVDFRYFNLISDRYPPFGQTDWDIIFCRNVTIYFKLESTKRVVEKFYNLLVDGGYLFLGYSETLHGISDRFQLVQVGEAFLYKKEKEPPPRPKRRQLPKTPKEKPKRSLNPEETLRKAWEDIREEKFDQAVQKLHDLKQEGHDSPEVLLALTWASMALGKEEEALTTIREILRRDPLCQDAYFLRGVIFSDRGEIHQAIDEFKKTLYIKRDHILARVYLGDLYRRQGRDAEAIREYRNALNFLLKASQEDLGPYAGGFTPKMLIYTYLNHLKERETKNG